MNDNEIFARVQFLDGEGVFSISYLKSKEDTQSVFEIRFAPEMFEKFVYDMLKIVKNFNLYQAQMYQEKVNEQNKIEMDDSTQENSGTQGPSEESENIV